MINNIILEGYVTDEIVADKVSGDKLVVNFRISVPRMGKSKDKQAFDTFQCVAWNSEARKIIEYVSKKDLISIEGHGESGSYTDRSSGKTVYTNKVVVDKIHFLSKRKGS